MLHAADWDHKELKAYLDLLSFIVAHRFDKEPASIWCMNLRTGKDEVVTESPRMRARSKPQPGYIADLSRQWNPSTEPGPISLDLWRMKGENLHD